MVTPSRITRDLDPLKINLKPDLKSLESLKRISKEVGAEVNQSLKESGETFSTGWKWIKVMEFYYLFLCF